MANYRRPDVYIEEIPSFPISVQEIESAVPVFIGCTEEDGPAEILPINNMEDFKKYYGKSGFDDYDPKFKKLKFDKSDLSLTMDPVDEGVKFELFFYYAVQHYFDNGGGKCFILSNGKIPQDGQFDAGEFKKNLKDNLTRALDIEEVTLIVIPELTNLVTVKTDSSDPQNVITYLDYSDMKDLIGGFADKISEKQRFEKFLILDMADSVNPKVNNLSSFDQSDFMSLATEKEGEYMAFYYPYLISTYQHPVKDDKFEQLEVEIKDEDGKTVKQTIKKLKDSGDKNDNRLATFIINKLKQSVPNLILPPSAAMAGVYYSVDNQRNVWKAPANLGINGIKKLHRLITDEVHADLNINTLNQRSICAIRNIPGYGIKVLGARTLRGASNEFRYINVRRTTSVFEKSIKNALKMFLFEPNNADTWAFVKATIESYLYDKWQEGAMYGSKQDQAFYVQVGLGITMNSNQVLNGEMIVKIGLAIVRPAEFIILEFKQIQPQA